MVSISAGAELQWNPGYVDACDTTGVSQGVARLAADRSGGVDRNAGAPWASNTTARPGVPAHHRRTTTNGHLDIGTMSAALWAASCGPRVKQSHQPRTETMMTDSQWDLEAEAREILRQAEALGEEFDRLPG